MEVLFCQHVLREQGHQWQLTNPVKRKPDKCQQGFKMITDQEARPPLVFARVYQLNEYPYV